MPNAIGHYGAQGVLTKMLIRDAPAPWILLAAVVPDVPWILQRAVRGLGLGVDPYDLRLYAVAQASLLVSLLLCAALAALASAPRRIFAVLALGSVLHLVLDGLQTKWANGVHLLAPLSWDLWNAGLFWPEDAATLWLTVLGVGFLVYGFREVLRGPDLGLATPSGARVAAALVLLAAYVLAPIVLLGGPRSADNHYVETLRDHDSRPGRDIELDRATFRIAGEERVLVLFTGEELSARGELPARNATVSVRGRFVDAATVQVRQLHDHSGWPRDELSLVGLLLLAVLWVLALVGRRGVPAASRGGIRAPPAGPPPRPSPDRGRATGS